MDKVTETGEPLVCAVCGHWLGRSLGERLLVGGAYISHRVIVRCEKCGSAKSWRPKKKPVDGSK